jgi:hypothetical protein
MLKNIRFLPTVEMTNLQIRLLTRASRLLLIKKSHLKTTEITERTEITFYNISVISVSSVVNCIIWV